MKKSIFSLLLAGAAVAIAVLLIWPKYQETKDLRSQITEKRMVLQQQEEYYKKLEDLEGKLKSYEEPMKKVDMALPEEAGVPDFFNFLQRISSENGLILENLGGFSLSVKKGEEIEELQVDFSASGSYSSFKSFLNTLGKSARLIEVRGISFPSSGKGEIFKFSLGVTTHFLSH